MVNFHDLFFTQRIHNTEYLHGSWIIAHEERVMDFEFIQGEDMGKSFR